MSNTHTAPLTLDQARQILKTSYGYPDFRPGQAAVIESLLGGRDTVAIMPTGAGKSLCFQIPALLYPGLTLVFSPLISLMKDQIDTLNSLGIPAALINSSLDREEIDRTLFLARQGEYKLLYLAPERLDTLQFNRLAAGMGISLVAIDEAHCISSWGHDFRPSYRRITDFLKALPKRPVITALTATATEEVREDIISLLDIGQADVHVTGFDRPNLKYAVFRGVNKRQFVLDTLQAHRGQSGIIYAGTRKEVDALHQMLQQAGYPAGRYHAGLSDRERHQSQEAFIYDRAPFMVATNAFGMGIDKPDVRFVLHYNMPRNLEAYYQEAGRAGRDGDPADCTLLYSGQDVVLQKFLIGQGELDPLRQACEYGKLQEMVEFCHTSACLRKYILAYFGEKDLPEHCGHCSSCCDEREEVDITLEAQQIFSCIYRMKERFGVSTVAQVLKGSKGKKILQMNLDSLSTYGLLKHLTLQAIQDLIQGLVADGYLYQTEGEYPVVRLRMKVKDVLRGEAQVHRRINQPLATPQVSDELFEQLRLLRRTLAQRENVPPYVIFPDATLQEMSARKPSDLAGLSQIKGVGSVKLEKYGADFLDVIQAYGGAAPAPGTGSHLKTLEFHRSGLPLAEIAGQRQITLQTVQEHLLRCAGEDHPIDWGALIPPEQEPLILGLVKAVGPSRLKSIKEALPAAVDYVTIKAVLVKHGYR